MVARFTFVLGLILGSIALYYLLFIELPFCSTTWGCDISAATVNNFRISSELPQVNIRPWNLSKRTFQKYLNASGFVYSDSFQTLGKTAITFTSASDDGPQPVKAVKNKQGQVAVGIYQVDGGFEIRYSQELLDDLVQNNNLQRELSFRIFFLFSSLANNDLDTINLRYTNLPQLITQLRLVSLVYAECVGNYGCRRCEYSCTCDVGGGSCGNTGDPCGPFNAGTCGCDAICDNPVTKSCSGFSQSLCQGSGGVCAPFEEIVYRDCAWNSPPPPPPPTSTPPGSTPTPTNPPASGCFSGCFSLGNCGEIGYVGGDGSCTGGQICCKAPGGALPPACDSVSVTIGAASQTVYVGEQGTARIDLYFRPNDSSTRETIYAWQNEPSPSPHRMAWRSDLVTMPYPWWQFNPSWWGGSGWTSSLVSPVTYYVPFWGKAPGTFNIQAQGTVDNGLVATCNGISQLITVLAAEGTINGYIFDASSLSSCPVTPTTGFANVPVVITNTSSGATFTTTTNASGFFQRAGLPAPATYSITYDTSAYPQVQNSPQKFLCDGGISSVAVNYGETHNRDIGLYQIMDSWWQVRGGDVYGEGGLETNIPATCTNSEAQTSCGTYSSGGNYYTPLVGGSDPGVALYTSGTLNLGGGGTPPSNAVISSNNWSGSAASPYDYDYAFYKSWIERTVGLSTTAWDGVNKPASSEETAYTSSGTLTWNHSLSAGQTIVVLHNGDVNISGEITVPVGAYLGIIASGNININSNVASVQGVYVAENINILSTGNTDTDLQFQGQGTFIGWTGVTLLRDLGVRNNSQPAELFTFRPDFVINAPRIMKISKYVWTEVKP